MDFGTLDEEYSNLYFTENLIDRTYLKHNQVSKGDVVVDIGANVGTFSLSVVQSKPAHTYCLEPNTDYFNALTNNMRGKNATLINGGINDYYSFNQFLNDQKIDQIDFMKVDCEGCEFLIFNEDNVELIKKTVKYTVGEYHISLFDNSVEHFIKFRDLYMRECRNVWLYQRDDTHITQYLFDDNWLHGYKDYWTEYSPYRGQFIFYLEL